VISPDSSTPALRPASAERALLPPVGLAWFGAIVSFLLAQPRAEVRMLFCPSRAGCDAVLASPHSSLMGLPLPRIGVAFYLGLLGLLLAAYGSRSAPWRARLVGLTVWLSVAALAFSGMLMWVQFGVLQAFCGLCTASALTVAGLVWATLRAERLAPAASGSPVLAWSLAAFALLATVGLALPIVVRSSEVVAAVDDRTFTRAEMEADLAATVQPLRRSIYEHELAWVQEKVDAELLASAARQRGVTIEALLGGRARAAVLPELAAGRRIEIRLAKPPLRGVKFDLAQAQVAGPRDARVQLVVFSDFACDYCRKLAPVLAKVRAEFPHDVLVAYRYYPLDANPRARPAALAAQCAAEQGAFWKYHDGLFAERGDGSEERLTALAVEVGLDVEKFQACRQSAAPQQIVAASSAEAVKLGIEGAPALFLNGDLIGGFVEYEALARRIRERLPAR